MQEQKSCVKFSIASHTTSQQLNLGWLNCLNQMRAHTHDKDYSKNENKAELIDETKEVKIVNLCIKKKGRAQNKW